MELKGITTRSALLGFTALGVGLMSGCGGGGGGGSNNPSPFLGVSSIGPEVAGNFGDGFSGAVAANGNQAVFAAYNENDASAGGTGLRVLTSSNASAAGPSFGLFDDDSHRNALREIWDVAIATDNVYVTTNNYLDDTSVEINQTALLRYASNGDRQAVANVAASSNRVRVVTRNSGPVYTVDIDQANVGIVFRDRTTLATVDAVQLVGGGFDLDSVVDIALAPESTDTVPVFFVLGMKGAQMRVQEVTIQSSAITNVVTRLTVTPPAGHTPAAIAVDSGFYYVLLSSTNSLVNVYRRLDNAEVDTLTHPALGTGASLAIAHSGSARQLLVFGENADNNSTGSARVFLFR